MARQIDKTILMQHKEQALKNFSDYMDFLIASDDSRLQGKADKLSYWMDDWTTFLSYELRFSPTSLRRYKRGEIIKVHLGFNVGSEEGGLHYAVVLDKNNSVNSPVVTVVPLTSVKPNTDVKNLHKGSVFLGNELFTSMSAKVTALQRFTDSERKQLHEMVSDIAHVASSSESEIVSMSQRLDELVEKCSLLERTRKEISKMKSGSIALVGQIRTISKIRIYDPKTNYDVLSGIKLSNEKLDAIDDALLLLYTNASQSQE